MSKLKHFKLTEKKFCSHFTDLICDWLMITTKQVSQLVKAWFHNIVLLWISKKRMKSDKPMQDYTAKANYGLENAG